MRVLRLSSFVLGLMLVGLTACQSAEVAPEPTLTRWQRVTFISSRLLPGFALNIPAEWHYQVSDSGIIIFNYPRLLDIADDGADLPAGSVMANLSMLSAADVRRIGARNAAGIIDYFVGAASGSGPGPQYSSADAVDIKGRDAAQSVVSIGASDSLLLAMSLDGHYLLGVIVTPNGEVPSQIDLLNQILASVELRLSQ